jgi:hypothetical protein
MTGRAEAAEARRGCDRRIAPLRFEPHDAGWSSSVARRAHNPKVAGSNPAPATKEGPGIERSARAFFVVRARLLTVLLVDDARKLRVCDGRKVNSGLADMPPFEPSKLARLAGSALSLSGYRNQAPGFDPRSGDGARRVGGRFNRPDSFPVVYLCTTRPCVVAELTRQARRQGLEVEDLLPRELWVVSRRRRRGHAGESHRRCDGGRTRSGMADTR